MDLMQRDCPNEGVQLSQMQSIIFDASLVLILLQELGRSCSERVVVSNAVQPRLTGLVYPLCELFLRFDEITRASAFANSNSSDLLVDMPDPTSACESGPFTLSHDLLLSD